MVLALARSILYSVQATTTVKPVDGFGAWSDLDHQLLLNLHRTNISSYKRPPRSSRMRKQLLLLLAGVILAHGQTSDSGGGLELDGLIKVTHNACPPSHDCIAQEKCAHFQVKYCPALFFGIICHGTQEALVT